VPQRWHSCRIVGIASDLLAHPRLIAGPFPMKILYVASRYDYGFPEQGPSFEHSNFYDTLANLGHDIHHFDFETMEKEVGRPAMNLRLRECAAEIRAELMFVVLNCDQFAFETIRSITDSRLCTTFNWFCDDHWRFDRYSRHWAAAFNWVSTTAACAMPWYAEAGIKNVIKTQWACNHFLYRKLDLPLLYDVSFVGRVYGKRVKLIERLRKKGLRVLVRGKGWPEGRATQEEMIQIFNQSRINLNFSASAKEVNWFKHKFLGRRRPPKQIKGRNFEIPGCGGFMLTDDADNLSDYYAPDKEIALFHDDSDLLTKIVYYLDHETERAQIALAGYQRTIREHTYAQRFAELFQHMGVNAQTGAAFH
jgi:spore maturation protein CgeB